MDDDDEYEQERLANIQRNQELLKDLDLLGHGRPSSSSNGHGSARGARKASAASSSNTATKRRTREVVPERVQPRRSSNRLAGLQADSEVVKRKLEEQEEKDRAAYEAAKRAKHEEHDLKYLLGEEAAQDSKSRLRLESALKAIISDAPALSVDLLESEKESKRRIHNGDGDVSQKYKALKDELDKMQLRSVDKAAQRRVYSMLMHPNTDKDVIFVGDKEGNVGVWEPLAEADQAADDAEEGEEEKNAAGNVKTGISWNLQVHGKSPITCLRFDPIAADTLFSSSYDSTIRAQNLQTGTSTEIWSGQEDVLISIFDILAPQSHPSAFTHTPDAMLDERSLWIADHRGGLCHVDLRERAKAPSHISTRRSGKSANGDASSAPTYTTRRWQVCEKKIGGMSINPTYSSCISVASLDQHVRLFDVRNLQTLDTTNDAPYSARNVDEEVLRQAESHAQIASHRAKLACTSVDWDPSGTKLVAVSYDDMIKLWDVEHGWLNSKASKASSADAAPKKRGRPSTVKKEEEESESLGNAPGDILAKPITIRHNNQTGKWLTLFRARFNANPLCESHFSIGSMDRKAEIWSADGTLLRTFYDSEYVTAVPAVTATHPRRVGRLVTGNASGKCTFWAAPDE